MNIKTFQGGYNKNLCSGLWCEESLRAAVIDAVNLINDSQKVVQDNSSQVVPLESQAITRINNDTISYQTNF